VLAREAKRRAARDQRLQIRCRGEKRANDPAGIDELLEIVEDKEEVLVTQVVVQRLGERLAGLLPHRKRLRDRRDKEVGIGDRGEVNEEGTVLEILEQLGRHLERKARLTRAAGAGECNEADVPSPHEGHGLGHLPLAPDKWRQLRRQVRGPRFKRLQRREVAHEPWNQELEEPLRVSEVLETVLAEVAQAYRVGEFFGKKIPR
jgi:hypothetical protein